MRSVYLSLLVASQAFAQMDVNEDYLVGGFIETDAGYNIYADDNLDTDLRGYAFGLGGGYSFDYYVWGNQLGLSAEYQFLTDTTHNGVTASTSLTYLDVELKRKIFDTYRLSGKLGAALWDTERKTSVGSVNATGISPHIKVGISKRINDFELGAFYNFVYKVGNDETRHKDIDQLSLNLRWYFGDQDVTPLPVAIQSEPTPATTKTKTETTPFDKSGFFRSEIFSNNFNHGSSKLIHSESLSNIVQIMKSYPTSRAILTGHTDDVGSSQSNMKLSLDRAKSVSDYLESQGIDKSRISYRGEGEHSPVVANDSHSNRAKNRRVDVEISCVNCQ
ncbi:putative Outer membrane protein A [Vibrio crassostreae]|jgi:OOP family OmpA-OmpF porin|uniref:Outer membrane protein A n=1 Tax=Vibrio crassostreae TaxID=246167 RepID=A0A822MN79_9VIBR|nr:MULTISPECIES: OmpA family protein [Vibrio]MDH5939686.1 OmpA family protein [Vibrio splendidus]TCL15449.1 outer membrane protein OmpA-like peptidoglycan-associated protein [Vibrio crassostreae]TCM98714.1 outer membrane protein OmpA-like peptidoglycan-associated protein [Vibrio crassostreae]TCT41207.1 outer membrane protein OmpA-like peptidoglycan-associated protein [Vibrio crassostreae]TCT45549.1 outer membrane protein OmpA-like peptidoglycan-associated protein [Vibrio crassostreae]